MMDRLDTHLRPHIPAMLVPRFILVINVCIALLYFSWWLQFENAKNLVLYGLLVIGEIYHVMMAIGFWFTIRKVPFTSKSVFTPKATTKILSKLNMSVDIFITVAGEPNDVVRETIRAAKQIEYPGKVSIYVLNDGYVAKKSNWRDIVELAKEEKIHCITRRKAGGAKAGNINNALRKTNGDVVVIFDADMVADTDFLLKLMLYFNDAKIGFVQSPQYYHNHAENMIAGAAWEQQALFFGPIMMGKNSSNAAFICGTNVAIRRTALMEAGGMFEDSIAEDFLTSLFIHQNGWKSQYVVDVLSKGLAPGDLYSYVKQQLRWARGSLEVLFAHNPVFKKGLSLGQKIEYLSSGLYYLNGLVVLIDIVIPLLFLFFGMEPISVTTTNFALLFLPFIGTAMFTLFFASEGSLSWRALSFSQASFWLQLTALQSVVLGKKMGFAVTSKKALEGNFITLVLPHIIYIGLAVAGSLVALIREGVTPAVITNISWVTFNCLLFLPFIKAAYPWGELRKYLTLPSELLFDRPTVPNQYD